MPGIGNESILKKCCPNFQHYSLTASHCDAMLKVGWKLVQIKAQLAFAWNAVNFVLIFRCLLFWCSKFHSRIEMRYYLYKSSLLSHYLENLSGLLLRKTSLEFLDISWKTSALESSFTEVAVCRALQKNGLQWRFQAINFSKFSEQLILGAHKDSTTQWVPDRTDNLQLSDSF